MKIPTRRLFGLFLVLSLLPMLACNLFTAGRTPTPESGESLRQTLQAMSLPSTTPALIPYTAEPSPSPLISLTEAPGEPLPTEPLAATPLPETAGINSTLTPLPDSAPLVGDTYNYTVRWGDTADSVAKRFNVKPEVIESQVSGITGYLHIGSTLLIPNTLGKTTLPYPLLPDSELVYSPTSLDFDLAAFIQQAGGFLSSYTIEVDGRNLSAAQAIQRVANELSVNPRLLLALLEYRSGLVYGQPADLDAELYPIGFYVPNRSGLYEEIKITATQLNVGYYGWRSGDVVLVTFASGSMLHISPDLNAGTASLLRLFGMLFKDPADWRETLYGTHSFLALYQRMYGDPWHRAAAVEPLLPEGLTQPPLELPFAPGVSWKFTGGPHDDWNAGTPRGALDFAPPSGGAADCSTSNDFAAAEAPGVIARAAYASIALDLDGDGHEQTGWVVVHLHLDGNLPAVGVPVALGDPLGYPSCEGGESTARHVHLSRKYNGEWLWADGPVPFVLSGWLVVPGESNYQGYLLKDGVMLEPSFFGLPGSLITR